MEKDKLLELMKSTIENYKQAGREDLAGAIDYFFWHLKDLQSPLPKSTTPDVPATNVGDIPEGREGFIEKVIEFIDSKGWSTTTTQDEQVADFMRSHWPTPADPIRVTKDDAIEWLLTKGIQGLEKREKMWVEHGGSTLFDYLQGKTITPADPGSQVEAALNWINENMPGLYVNQPVWSIETHDPAGFESDSSKEVDYTTADLITLYKQSL